MAEFVERNDPGEWHTHWNNDSEPDPEAPLEERIKGMAALVKADDSFLNDPDLHNLPDDAMLLLWAAKTSEGARIIQPWALISIALAWILC